MNKSSVSSQRCTNDRLTQISLLQVDEVLSYTSTIWKDSRGTKHSHLLNVLQGRSADDHRVTMLALEQAVMRDPAERDLRHRQLVLLGDRLDRREGLEVRLVPVPVTTCQ